MTLSHGEFINKLIISHTGILLDNKHSSRWKSDDFEIHDDK